MDDPAGAACNDDLLATPDLVEWVAEREGWRPHCRALWEHSAGRLRECGVNALTIVWDADSRSPAHLTARRDERVLSTLPVRAGLQNPVLTAVAAVTSAIAA